MAATHGKLLEDAGLRQVPILTSRRGIYFLMKAGAIQYIGKTEDIYRRLGQHINAKEFDDVMFLPTEAHPLQAYEDACIRIFHPPLNHAKHKGPIEVDDVIMLRHLVPHGRYLAILDRLRRHVHSTHPGNAVKFPGKLD